MRSLLLLVLLVLYSLFPASKAWMPTPSNSSGSRNMMTRNIDLASERSPLTMSTRARTVPPTTTAAKLFGGTEEAANSSLQPSPQQRGRRQQHLWRLFGSSNGSNNEKLADTSSSRFQWTTAKALQALAVFVVSGLAEIGGGWLVWKAVREKKPWWWALIGSGVLVLYGFLPTLQPTDSFGRIYAVYGGFFIALSYAWGWFFDGMKPDLGDVVGGSLALLAVLVILFWPRQQ